MSYHLKKVTNFDVNRINSIHHGQIGFSINNGSLMKRKLVIEDNLTKSSIPPKKERQQTVIQQIINTIDLNRKTYNSIENGTVYFFIRDWRLYKQEMYLSDIDLGNQKSVQNSYVRQHGNINPDKQLIPAE